jgi:hypothetical protein
MQTGAVAIVRRGGREVGEEGRGGASAELWGGVERGGGGGGRGEEMAAAAWDSLPWLMWVMKIGLFRMAHGPQV